ncbi:MAG: TRAP transporter small permease [Hyphomicrobiales bacterium]
MAHKGQSGLVQTVLLKTITALENVSSLVIFIMMIITFVDVIGRYFFTAPIFGASEMISALLAITIFAGLGVTNARDDHIVVELFDGPIRRIAPRTYNIIVQVFSVFAMSLVAYVLFENAWEHHHQNARTFVLEFPLFIITGLVALLAIISVLSMISGIIVHVRKTSEAEHEAFE